MASENPLVALGVPRHVLVLAVKDKNPKLALEIAEANYKSLAKKFHPDLPGGDAVYMGQLGDAIDEIRDLDALDYYLSELVGRGDVAEAKVQEKVRKSAALIEKRDSYSLRAISDLFEYVDQFTMLGLRKPTSFFTFGQNVILTVDVTDEDSTDLIGYIDANFHSESSDHVRYTAGKWQFKNEFADFEAEAGKKATKAWHDLGEPSLRTNAKVIGYTIMERKEETDVDSDVHALGAGAKINDLSWTKASESWFLPFISFGGLPVGPKESLDAYDIRLVFYRAPFEDGESLFSVSQRIIKFNAIK